MNIKMQCCGLIILLVIIFIYSRQKKINLNTEKAFLRLLIMVAIGLTLDICSLFALNYSSVLPVLVVDFFCKSYISTLVLIAYSGLMYVCVDVFNQGSSYKKRAWIYNILTAVEIIIIFILPIYKEVEDKSNMYTYGPSVIATYISCVVYLLLITILILRSKNRMNPKRRRAVIAWVILWIGAAMIQFIDNRILIVGFAGAVGVMVVYLILENPESNRDRDTGLFNETAFLQYVKQMYSNNEDFGLIEIIFPHANELFHSEEAGLRFKIDVIDYVCSLPEVFAFQSMEDELLLVLKPNMDINTVETMLRSRFAFGWGKNHEALTKPNYMIMPSALILNRPEDVLPFLHYVRQNHNDFTDDDRLVLDLSLVNHMYDEWDIELLISSALKYDRIEVFYQPIFSTKENRFTSAEALCRIYNENGDIIPPARFIEVAEKNGMILKLGERVFEKVCQFLQSGMPQQLGIKYIEVNLSVVQCSYVLLSQQFIHIMEEYQIEPSQINLEITETGSVSTRKIMLENMQKLINYGVQFSLDDFGTGNSNLNYIVDMPVNIVKFDRSMTNSYFNNGKAKYVMDAAMHMIHGMELQIVSEGIETEEQLDTMKELDISYIQGYYFSKPLPQEEFLNFLRDNNR